MHTKENENENRQRESTKGKPKNVIVYVVRVKKEVIVETIFNALHEGLVNIQVCLITKNQNGTISRVFSQHQEPLKQSNASKDIDDDEPQYLDDESDYDDIGKIFFSFYLNVSFKKNKNK